MKPMKVVVSEELDAKVRQKAAATKGLRKGALSEVVGEALERWVDGGEPELYVGVLRDGMSLEIPQSLVADFLRTIVETLRTKRVNLYYRRKGEEISRDCTPENLSETLLKHGISPLDPHFVAEIGKIRFYTGGDGCISLEGKISAKERTQLLHFILSRMGLRAELSQRMPLHIQARHGRVEVD